MNERDTTTPPDADSAPGVPQPEAEAVAPSEPVAQDREGEAETPAIPDVLPVLATGASVLYPAIVVPFVSADPADVGAVDAAMADPARIVGVFGQQQAEGGVYSGAPQPFGVAATVLRMVRGPQGGVQAIIQGVTRVRVVEVLGSEPFYRVRVEPLEDVTTPSAEVEALKRNVLDLFERVVALTETIPDELSAAARGIQNPGNLADFIAANLPFTPEEKVSVLAATDVTERMRLVNGFLAREVEVAQVGQTIRTRVQGEMDKRQRDFILREQLVAIQRELGQEENPELADLRRKLDEAHLPEEPRREADRELERLGMINAASPEYGVARTYLEWLAALPWDKRSEEHIDIAEAERILDEDHYGLERVKQRILDYLAVRALKLRARQNADTPTAAEEFADAVAEPVTVPEPSPTSQHADRSPILCLVGPPGVGKTSLGQSIARATGRVFVRMALGGMRDEAEIRGHRRTYVGALPGRVVQELRRAEVNNPLMMLDEVDKLASDYRGDPASALLEVLDPAQNNTFRDHYLDVAFDLSGVLFIATANQLDPIPGPLRDRMEVIEIPGYTEREKLEIARRYLLPRQTRENGLDPERLTIPDETLLALQRGYTREAGVRNLERAIGSVCRRLARRVAAGDSGPFTVAPDDLPDLLGVQPIPEEALAQEDMVGVATGMAYTPAGGDVLFIEAAVVPGKGAFSITGKLGDVMQESARAALTYARRRAPEMGVPAKFFEQNDIHVHVPAGAVPKDGPSAGVTMATAIVSAITNRPVRHDVSMTGEISLRGRVLPVGGIKEKVLAAHRTGIRTIVIPKDNARDLADIPADLRGEIAFTFAENVDDVLNVALMQSAAKGRGRARTPTASASRAGKRGPAPTTSRAGANAGSEPPTRRRTPRAAAGTG